MPRCRGGLTIREGSGNGTKCVCTDMIAFAGVGIRRLELPHYPPLGLFLLPSTQSHALCVCVCDVCVM